MNRFAINGQSAFAIAATGLLLVDGWLGWNYWSQADEVDRATAQTTHLETLAVKIEKLRRQPVQVEESTKSSDALAKLVETVAKQVDINPEQIVRIDPGEPRQLEKTSYFEQRTNVELREIPLQKIVEFSMALEASGTAMEVPTLLLRIPAGTEATNSKEELWNAQLTLTCHIYESSKP